MPDNRILMGVFGRAHGVSGRLKVTSHTADPADITAYGPLFDETGQRYVLRWTSDGIAEVSRLVDGAEVRIRSRTEAEKLTNVKLYADRSVLPPSDDDEFYVTDLIGLLAVDVAGKELGTIETVHDYGAGASLEIVGPRPQIVPFTAACVPVVDIAAGRVVIAPPDEIIVTEDVAA